MARDALVALINERRKGFEKEIKKLDRTLKSLGVGAATKRRKPQARRKKATEDAPDEPAPKPATGRKAPTAKAKADRLAALRAKRQAGRGAMDESGNG